MDHSQTHCGCRYKHDDSAVGLGLAGTSLPWISDKIATHQAAKGHDRVLTDRYHKLQSLNELLSCLFYADTL